MSKAEIAAATVKEGFGCAQAILSVYGPPLGLDRETALKMGSAFAGGMGRSGETCGAVNGALMVIGLKYGRTKAGDQETQMKTDSKVKEFIARFKARDGSILCRDLLGTNIGTPEGMDEAKKKELFRTLCPRLVQDAAGILEELLAE